MVLSEHEDPKKTAKDTKTLSPDQEEQKALREKQQEVTKKFHWEELKGRRLFKYKRSDGTSIDEPENPNDPISEIGTGVSYPGLKKMEEGWYELYENEGDKETDPKYKVMVYVTKDGALKPYEEPFDPYKKESMERFNFKRTQVIRAYTAGLGINRLTLDFPNCYDKEGNPDPSKFNLINLDKVMRTLKIAEKEGAAISIPPGSALEARLANPKNKKEAKLCKKILKQAKQTQTALAEKTELKKQQDEVTHTFHADGLKKDAAALKAKSDELKTMTPADASVKLKELKTAKDKLSKRLDRARADFDVYRPSTDICKKYETSLTAVDQVLTEVSRTLNEVEKNVPVTEKTTFDEIKTSVNDASQPDSLKSKVDSFAKKAGVDSLESVPRANEKIKELKTKITLLDKAVAEVEKATPADLKGALENLNKAIQATTKAVKSVSSETDKQVQNNPEEYKRYQDAVKEAEKSANIAQTKVNGISGKEGQPEEVRRECENITTNNAVLISTVDQTQKDLDKRMNPPELVEAKELKEIEDRINDMETPAEKLEELREKLEDLDEQRKDIESAVAILREDLGKYSALEEEAEKVKLQEKIEEKQQALEQKQGFLEKCKKKFEEILKGINSPGLDGADKAAVENYQKDLKEKIHPALKGSEEKLKLFEQQKNDAIPKVSHGMRAS